MYEPPANGVQTAERNPTTSGARGSKLLPSPLVLNGSLSSPDLDQAYLGIFRLPSTPPVLSADVVHATSALCLV